MPNIKPKYSCPYAEYAWQNRFKDSMWKDLAGNAMHTGLLGMILAFWLSSFHFIPAELRLLTLSVQSDGEDEEKAQG